MELRDLAASWLGIFRIVLNSFLSSVCMSARTGCAPAIQEGYQLLENLFPGLKQDEKLESQSEWSLRPSCLEFGCAEEENK